MSSFEDMLACHIAHHLVDGLKLRATGFSLLLVDIEIKLQR